MEDIIKRTSSINLHSVKSQAEIALAKCKLIEMQLIKKGKLKTYANDKFEIQCVGNIEDSRHFQYVNSELSTNDNLMFNLKKNNNGSESEL
jgi:phosphoribosylpyrophosphate synthetase